MYACTACFNCTEYSNVCFCVCVCVCASLVVYLPVCICVCMYCRRLILQQRFDLPVCPSLCLSVRVRVLFFTRIPFHCQFAVCLSVRLQGKKVSNHDECVRTPALTAYLLQSALSKSPVGQTITGVTVPASILAQAAASTGTIITTSQMPSYFKNSEPREYNLPDMERCMYICRLGCETGDEIPAVNGLPALPIERPRVCKKQCLQHCGFGRPFVPR